MLNPRILVTGAAGQTGSAVTRLLLAAGYPVRALVRRVDWRSEALRKRGAELAVGDMGDPEAVAKALVGVQRAYFVAGFDPAMLHQAVVFATAVAEARLEQVVQMTQWLASPAHPALMTRQHWLADRVMAMVPGIAHTLVEPGFFADMPYLTTLSYAAHLGIYPWPFGEGRNAPPSVEDIAAVVTGVLADPAQHAGRRYRPTGPELLDGPAMARIVGKALERRVRLVPMPFWMFLRAARLEGFPIALLAMLKNYAADHSEGAFSLGAPTDHVVEVTGRAPESFESIARRQAKKIERGFGPALKQFARLMMVPMVPAPAIDRYIRELRQPTPTAPVSATRSVVWRREHAIDTSPPRLPSAFIAPPRNCLTEIHAGECGCVGDLAAQRAYEVIEIDAHANEQGRVAKDSDPVRDMLALDPLPRPGVNAVVAQVARKPRAQRRHVDSRHVAALGCGIVGAATRRVTAEGDRQRIIATYAMVKCQPAPLLNC